MAKSGLPPPLPPAMAAIFLTRAPAFRPAGLGVLGDANGHHSLAAVAADQHGDSVGALSRTLSTMSRAGVSAPVPVR